MMDRKNTITWVLAVLVIILGIMVLYAFVLQPQINGYVVNAQNQGVNHTIAYIVNQIQQQGYAQLPVGNQTLILVPYNLDANTGTSETQSSKTVK